MNNWYKYEKTVVDFDKLTLVQKYVFINDHFKYKVEKIKACFSNQVQETLPLLENSLELACSSADS